MSQTMIADQEAADITAGLPFRELVHVVTTSTDTAKVTIACARSAGAAVLDSADAPATLGAEDRVCGEALALVLARVRGGPGVG